MKSHRKSSFNDDALVCCSLVSADCLNLVDVIAEYSLSSDSTSDLRLFIGKREKRSRKSNIISSSDSAMHSTMGKLTQLASTKTILDIWKSTLYTMHRAPSAFCHLIKVRILLEKRREKT